MVSRKRNPHIYWSQTEQEVNIKIDLRLDDMKPNIKIKEKSLLLDAYGFGSSDDTPNFYFFEIDLYEAVDIESSMDSISSTDTQLLFKLKKQNKKRWWSRLTAQPQKQNWIHIDEENWISRDDDKDDSEPEYRDIRTDYPGIESFLHQEEFGYRPATLRTSYLFLYNLYQFIAFLYIWLVLVIEWNRDGFNLAASGAFQTVGMPLKVSQVMQYFEVLHSLVGYTSGSAIFPLIQVSGRNFILFGFVNAEERIQMKPIVLCLFIVWSSVEIIRYPYYIVSLVKGEIWLLTWLRYSVYVILYPLGFMCEGLVMLLGLHYLDDTKRFTIELPNKWNFTFSLAYFTKFYMTFVFLPGLYVVMKHMTKLRGKKLRTPNIRHKAPPSTPRQRKTI